MYGWFRIRRGGQEGEQEQDTYACWKNVAGEGEKREGEELIAVLCPLFLREGDGEHLPPSLRSFISRT